MFSRLSILVTPADGTLAHTDRLLMAGSEKKPKLQASIGSFFRFVYINQFDKYLEVN